MMFSFAQIFSTGRAWKMKRDTRRAVRGVEMMQVLARVSAHSGRMSERQMIRQPTPLSMARSMISG